MEIDELKNKTLTLIEVGSEYSEIIFHTVEGEKYKLFHRQECCEDVFIDDICGDLQDLTGTPLLIAEERSSGEVDPEKEAGADSFTWTFYELATIKGNVTIRWFGESNSYYSEDVDFELIEKGEKEL